LRTRSIPQLLILALICWLAITPFLRWGSPSGHDFEFHMYSWMEVLQQWKQGIIYPRWAALAHWGYGEARFLFYPPGSWTLGAALGALLPWKIVPGVYCWLVLTAAGTGMYALARRWLPPPDALFAAAFYAINPYHLLVVYWRSAYAELLAAVFIPLALLCLLRVKEGGIRSILWLSLVLAGAWLVNAPAAMMIHYSVAGLALVIALQARSAGSAIRILVRIGLAVILGAVLASFYLLPAVYEEPWVNIAALLSPGVRPQDDFLFTMVADADHNRFNLLVSLVALTEIMFLVFAIWFARERNQPEDNPFRQSAWLPLAAWGTATAFVMLPLSNPLWIYLPKFRFVQLPFRWLLCLNAPLALLLAAATIQSSSGRPGLGKWAVRGLISCYLLAMLLFAGHRIQPPWWDQAADIQEMQDAISDGSGYEGTDEYVPVGADPYELKKDLPLVSAENGAAVRVQELTWGTTEKHVKMRADSRQNVVLRLFNYPAWQVTVNGRRPPAGTSDVTGLMIIPVEPGDNEIRVVFTRTADRLAGIVVSLLALVLFFALWLASVRKPPAHVDQTEAPLIPRSA
jgi:uncharacterized membrane protein